MGRRLVDNINDHFTAVVKTVVDTNDDDPSLSITKSIALVGSQGFDNHRRNHDEITGVCWTKKSAPGLSIVKLGGWVFKKLDVSFTLCSWALVLPYS